MDTALLKEFAALEGQRRELETHLAAVKERIAAVKPALLEQFGSDGIQNVTVEGLVVYLRRDLWASADRSDPEKLQAAFETAGLGWLLEVTCNANKLSAQIREWDRDGVALPEVLTGVVSVREVFDLRSNVAGEGRGRKRNGGEDVP